MCAFDLRFTENTATSRSTDILQILQAKKEEEKEKKRIDMFYLSLQNVWCSDAPHCCLGERHQ